MATTKEEKIIEIVVNGQKAGASLKEMQSAARALNAEVGRLTPGTKEWVAQNGKLQEMNGRIKDIKSSMTATNTVMTQAKSVMASLGLVMGVTFAVQKVWEFFSKSSDGAKEFEKSLSELSSITGVVGEDLEYFKKEALAIGEATKSSAADVVNAFKLIGSAKPELLADKEALAAVTKEAIILSKAAGTTIPEAAEALTISLNQFGLQGKESSRIINVLAAGSKEGAGEISYLTDSIKRFGPTAASMKISVEQSAAAMETLAEKGLESEKAGTQFRNILIKLSQGADEFNPKVVGLQTALDNLAKKQMDTAEMAQMFGAENLTAAQILSDNSGRVDEFTKKLTGTKTAYEQAATNTDNFQGDLAELSAVTEGVTIWLGDKLNGALRIVVKGMTAFVLGLKEAPKWLYENRDVIGMLAIAVLTLNANNIKTAATTLYHSAVEKGRALLVRGSAAAQWALNAAMTANPIGLLITAVALVVGAFVVFYNRSEQLRGGIAGLWEAIKELGGRIGDLFVGLATGNFAMVAKAFSNLGKSVGDAFNKGYDEKIKSEKPDPITDKDKKKAVDAGKDMGKKTADAVKDTFADSIKKMKLDQLESLLETETDAIHKKLLQKEIKHRKEQLKAREESQQEFKKLRDDFLKAEEKAELTLADLKVQVMEEGIDKTLAKLELQHQRELKELDKQRLAVLSNTAASGAEKQQLIDTINETEWQKQLEHMAQVDEAVAADEAKKLEEKKQKEAERSAEAEAQQELERLQIENTYLVNSELEQAALADQAGLAMQAEIDRDEALYQLRRKHLTDMLNLTKVNFGEESVEFARAKNQLLALDKDHSAKAKANAKATEDFKRKVQTEGYEVARGFVDLGLELLNIDAKHRKENAGIIKAFSMAKVLVDLQSEIAGYMAHPGSISSLGVVGGVKSALAAVRAGVAINTIRTAAFAEGGNTGKPKNFVNMFEKNGVWEMLSGNSGGSLAPGGWWSQPNVATIAEKGPEWVAPNWMIRDPKVMNTIGFLESYRQSGGKAFEKGGGTVDNAVRPLALPSGDGSDLQRQMLQAILQMNINFQKIDQWQRDFTVHLPLIPLKKELDKVSAAQKDIGLGG